MMEKQRNSPEIQDVISVEAHCWLAIRVIHRSARKIITFFPQTLRISGALPTAEQTDVLMEPERACGSSPGDGSTLSSLLTSTPRRSAHCWMRTPRQRRAGYRRFWRLCRRSTTRLIFSFYGKSWFFFLFFFYARRPCISSFVWEMAPQTGSGGRSHRRQT